MENQEEVVVVEGGDNQPEPKVETTKEFTQTQIDNMISDRISRATKGMVDLSELGVDNVDNLKTIVTTHQETVEKSKTEIDKANERTLKLEKELEQSKLVIQEKDNKVLAMKLGVEKDAINDALTLAKTRVSEELDMEQAMKEVLKQYPHFVKKGTEYSFGKESSKKDNNPKTKSSLVSAYNKRHNIK